MSETKKMMTHVQHMNTDNLSGKKITVSVEIEKMRDELHELIPLADVVFVSKDHSRSMGWPTVSEALKGVSELACKE